MAKSLDIKLFIKHLANGSIADNLCVVCLSPLQIDKFQSIFNLICKEDKCYCIADVLQTVCQVQFQNSEYYNICSDCFTATSIAYKLYLRVKETEEMLNFYTNELLSSVENVKVNPQISNQILYITLPNKSEAETHPKQSLFKQQVDNKDFSNSVSCNLKLDSINRNNSNKRTTSNQRKRQTKTTISNNTESINTDEISTNQESGDSDSEDIIFSVDDDEAIYFKVETNDSSSQFQEDQESDEDIVMIVNEKKERKKRDPLNSMNCTRCPVKYRFVSKLREHMKSAHDVDMFYCKICKIITEQKEEYEKHLASHTGEYQCTLCNAMYKKERTLLTHMESHQRTNNFEQTGNGNICEVCGILLESEESLQQHYSDKHIKRYTCYYCGRLYMGEAALNIHIKKHENKMKSTAPQKEEKEKSNKRSVCTTCGKDFVDERSLLWHQRLHDDDKPFPCQQCGRRFVSRPRRNQHALCAHTPPARRCPLCPALFHLRSMVNTHIKKVSSMQPAHTPPARRCPLCPALFHLRSMVNTHIKKVSSMQPAHTPPARRCPLCPALFHLRSMVNTHIKKVSSMQPAHTPPARRCPLCPALFHLRSMVNTHIKKVHLKTHKRRNRTSKYENVYWKTKTVPIQELSISIQDEILELQAKDDVMMHETTNI